MTLITEKLIRDILHEALLLFEDEELGTDDSQKPKGLKRIHHGFYWFCKGDKDIPSNFDFRAKLDNFLKLAERFEKDFSILKSMVKGSADANECCAKAIEIFKYLFTLNQTIYKGGGKDKKHKKDQDNPTLFDLKKEYEYPIRQMYQIKYSAVANMGKLIKKNRNKFPYVSLSARTEGNENRSAVIDVHDSRGYGAGSTFGEFHIPERTQYIDEFASITYNFDVTDADEILPNGRPNPIYNKNYDKDEKYRRNHINYNYKWLIDNFKTVVDNWKTDHPTPEELKQMELRRQKRLEDEQARQEKAFLKKRKEVAADGIRRGFIMPVFNSPEKPCIIKQKIKGKDAYNAIPSAIQNTTPDIMLRDEKTKEVIWFRKKVEKGNEVDFKDSFPEGYEGMIDNTGEFICYTIVKPNNPTSPSTPNNEMVAEMIIRKMVKRVLSEMYYRRINRRYLR